MSEDDITILPKVLIMRSRSGDKYGRLYYYQGNFYFPLTMHGRAYGYVHQAIRKFMRDNADLVAADRAHPDYKTPVELFDEQEAQFGRAA